MKNVAIQVKKALNEDAYVNVITIKDLREVKKKLADLNDFIFKNHKTIFLGQGKDYGYETILVHTESDFEELSSTSNTEDLRYIAELIKCDDVNYFQLTFNFDENNIDDEISEEDNLAIKNFIRKYKLVTKKYPELECEIESAEIFSIYFNSINDIDRVIECYEELITTFNL